jgi:hypothetical protein
MSWYETRILRRVAQRFSNLVDRRIQIVIFVNEGVMAKAAPVIPRGSRLRRSAPAGWRENEQPGRNGSLSPPPGILKCAQSSIEAHTSNQSYGLRNYSKGAHSSICVQ